MRRVAGLLVNLVLLAVTLMAMALVGEFALRAAAVPGDRTLRDGEVKHRFNPYRPDGVLGYVLRPDWEAVHEHDDFRVTVHTNGLGLRGDEASAAKPAGVFRVLLLGDSFAFGFGVEDHETFAARLQHQLPPPAGFDRVEVLNAGVAGWSADHYLLFLRTRGLALDPDLILLALTENDPGDLRWNRLRLGPDGLPRRIASTRRMIDQRGRMRYLDGGPLALPELRVPASAWLSDHSELYHWLRFRLAKLWISRASREELTRLQQSAGPPPTGAIEALSEDQIQRGLWSGNEFTLRYHRFLVDAIRRESGERGIPLYLVLVQFGDSSPKPGNTEGALLGDCERDPRCRDSGSMLGPDDGSHFFPNDGHWTPHAHARIANALAPWLTPPN